MIFPTQESNPGLLHCWQILYQLSYEGSPIYIYEINNLYREGEKKNLSLVVCFLLPLEREKKRLTLAAYFLRLETPSLPACYPLTLESKSAQGCQLPQVQEQWYY